MPRLELLWTTSPAIPPCLVETDGTSWVFTQSAPGDYDPYSDATIELS